MPKERKVVSRTFHTDAGKWLSKNKQRVKVPRIPDTKFIPCRASKTKKRPRSFGKSIENFFQKGNRPLSQLGRNETTDKEMAKLGHSPEIRCGSTIQYGSNSTKMPRSCGNSIESFFQRQKRPPSQLWRDETTDKEMAKLGHSPEIRCASTIQYGSYSKKMPRSCGNFIENFFQRQKSPPSQLWRNETPDKENAMAEVHYSPEIPCTSDQNGENCLGLSFKQKSPTNVCRGIKTCCIPEESCGAQDFVPAGVQSAQHSKSGSVPLTSDSRGCGSPLVSQRSEGIDDSPFGTRHLVENSQLGDFGSFPPSSLDFLNFHPVATSTQIFPDSGTTDSSEPSSFASQAEEQRQPNEQMSDCRNGLVDNMKLENESVLIDPLSYELSMRFTQDSQGNLIFCRLSPTKVTSG